MIRIACTNCKTVLSIDDAFAGGVCRCQHCGTIQTVPAHAKNRGGTKQTVSGSKAIYHRGGKSPDASDSLDELAGAVASSGLSGSGLTSRRLTRPTSRGGGGGSKSNMTVIFALIGAVILVLVIVIIWLVTRSSSTPVANGQQELSPHAPVVPTPAPVTSGPSFCGIKLDAPSVIYVLDRGTATKEVFSGLKEAALKSAKSLGSQRKFEILFWSNDAEKTVAGYPESSTTYATQGNVDAASRAVDDISASGASDAKPALAKAVSHDPSAIVLATAKGYDLDEAWVQEMLDARGPLPVKIHTVDLGSGAPSAALKALASKTGGEYRQVNGSQLSTFAGQ